MNAALKSPRKTATKVAPATHDKLGASCELDAPVHAKVEAFRHEIEAMTGIGVSFAAALRKIVTDWAKDRPTPKS